MSLTDTSLQLRNGYNHAIPRPAVLDNFGPADTKGRQTDGQTARRSENRPLKPSIGS